ncbi:MAG: copper resistance protein NlpE [Actinomycetota bacterium]|nr:copper resistance protein NlpE [Actinomycetota bacterium]
MAAGEERALYEHWVHSHEEDTDDEMVFRPASYPFPPSRGRTSFELRPDGTYLERSPGPVDLPEESTGSWSLEGNRLVLGAEGDRSGHAWEVTATDPDRLVVRK